MSLHDTFRLSGPVICPLDGSIIREWSDDGGGSMLTWVQGRPAPLEADNPDPEALFGASGQERLPPFFGLRAWHDDHDLLALGETDHEDVWTNFRLMEVRASIPLPGEFWPATRADAKPMPRFESLRLWRAYVGLYPEALARLEQDRERQRAELPAHGGNATCQVCWEEPRRPAVALIPGHPGFVCAQHLAERAEVETRLVLR